MNAKTKAVAREVLIFLKKATKGKNYQELHQALTPKNIEEMAETLNKSGGDIEWDYALMKRLPVLAEKNADKTLEIIENYLLDSDKKLNQNREAPLLYRDDIKRAMKIIYDNGSGEIKRKAADLINTLIEKGSSMFWGLKSVLEEDKINHGGKIKTHEAPKQGKPLVGGKNK